MSRKAIRLAQILTLRISIVDETIRFFDCNFGTLNLPPRH